MGPEKKTFLELTVREFRKLERISRIYEKTKNSNIIFTKGGVFASTGIAVAYKVLDTGRELDLLDNLPGNYLLDAGSGDGCFLAMASYFGLNALGIECDPDLVKRSERFFDSLLEDGLIHTRPRVVVGDYLSKESYRRLGVSLQEVGLIYNYDDGNLEELLDFVGRNSSQGTRLMVLNPRSDKLPEGMFQEHCLELFPEFELRVYRKYCSESGGSGE